MRKMIGKLIVWMVVCCLLLPLTALTRAEQAGGLINLGVKAPGRTQTIITHQDRAALLSIDFEKAEALLSLVDLHDKKLISTQNLQSGLIFYEADSYSLWEAGFLDDGSLYAINQPLGQLALFDKQLNRTRDISLPKDDLLYENLVQSNGETVWLGGIKEALSLFSIADGSQRQIKPNLPAGFSFSRFLGEWEGRVHVLYTDEQGLSLLCSISPDGKSQLSSLRPDSTQINRDSVFLQAGLAVMLGRLPDQGQYRFIPNWREMEYPMELTTSLMFTSQYQEEQVILRVYDQQAGLLLQELALAYSEENPLYQASALDENGFMLFVFQKYDDPEGELFRWDVRQAPLNRDIGMVGVTMEDLRQGNDELAGAIEAQHGIHLFLREQGIRFRDDTYQGEVSKSELKLRWTLTLLKQFLDSLPDNMIQEAVLPYYEGLNVYLAGSLQQRGLEGIPAPGGFASSIDARRSLVLTTENYTQLSTIVHEFMHIFEDRLGEHTTNGEGVNLLALWENLGPEGVPDRGYVYRYTDDSGYVFGDGRYTAERYDEAPTEDTVWFINAYSRTFPIEDRSLLFEHSYPGAVAYLVIRDYPHLLTKARALHALLRMAFPSVQAVQEAVWEQGMERMGQQELEGLLILEGAPVH